MLYFGVAPVRRHLAAAGGGIVLGADRGEQHLERGDAELQAQRAIAVVGIEPVVAGAQRQAGGGEHRFVAGAADLEKDLALVFELDFLVVQLARQQHAAVRRRAVDRGSALRRSCASRSFRTAFIRRNYSIRPCWYMLDFHEQPDGAPASMGRNRPRKSDRNAVAQAGHRREGNARADLLEARLPGAESLARERADHLRAAGRAEVPDRRRGDHRARRRGAAHPAWVEHQAEALEDTFELDIFSPIRQDWLDHTDDYFHRK